MLTAERTDGARNGVGAMSPPSRWQHEQAAGLLGDRRAPLQQ
jgi:hypothetical protein